MSVAVFSELGAYVLPGFARGPDVGRASPQEQVARKGKKREEFPHSFSVRGTRIKIPSGVLPNNPTR